MNIAHTCLSTIALAGCLALVACGGGGGSSTPSSAASSGSSSSSSTSNSSSGSGGNGSTYSKTVFITDAATVLSTNYNALNIAVADLNTTTGNFCGDTSSEAEFTALQDNWRRAMNRWQSLQGINFGPAEDSVRRSRMAFYPADRNQLASRINDLIAGTDSIDENAIAEKSVDLQGLVALEQILFRSDALATINAADASIRYCQLLQAIAANLLTMTTEINTLWAADAAYFSSFTRAENTEQSLEDLFGGLVEHFQIIENNKLRQPAVGNSGDIESPLAKTSMENIAANLSALEQFMFMDEDSGIDQLLEVSGDNSELLNDITTRINTLKAALANNDTSVVDLAATTAGSAQLETLAESVRDVLEKFATDIAIALDVFIGFNGADGD
ncbi:MAG: imelysin family protein [Cellvibrionaceae bacterium]|nr:imelysin family protein [Cellvibrionaceae bacterium]